MPGAIDLLKDTHGRSHGVMTGSGTSALVLALWSLGLHGKRIAIPNGVCYSVPLAVILSGNEPVFLDIDRETLSLGREQLIEHYHTWDAVIAVHNYGARCAIEQIAKYCDAHNRPLIEDCCVALGAEDIGHWGDVSVFSFGAGKIVSLGCGGALLSDDAEVVAMAARMQQLFSGDVLRMRHLSALHTRLYNVGDRSKWSVFGTVARSIGFSLLVTPRPGSEHGRVYDELLALWRNVEERGRKFYRLWERLRDHVEVLEIPANGVDWRFNCWIEDGRDDLMRHLWSKNYRASSWHAPADLFFGGRDINGPLRGTDRIEGNYIVVEPPVTDWVADHILNLWVDSTVDDEYIDGVSSEIRRWNND